MSQHLAQWISVWQAMVFMAYFAPIAFSGLHFDWLLVFTIFAYFSACKCTLYRFNSLVYKQNHDLNKWIESNAYNESNKMEIVSFKLVNLKETHIPTFEWAYANRYKDRVRQTKIELELCFCGKMEEFVWFGSCHCV